MSEINKNSTYTKEESITQVDKISGEDKTTLQNAFTSVLNSFKAKYF